MKKFVRGLWVFKIGFVLFGLWLLITGYVLYLLQAPFHEVREANGIELIVDNNSRVFDYAKERFALHSMGIGSEEKMMTVRIEKPQYKEEAEKYFRNLLDSNGMTRYEIEVYVDDPK